MASTSGRRVVVPLTNKSGGSVALGDIVVIGNGTDDSCFTTTTTAAFNARMIGVAQETIANNATGRVLIRGMTVVNSGASLTRDHFLFASTVAKECTGSATRAAGAFGQVLATGTDPVAIVWGMPDPTVSASATAAMQAICTHQGTSSLTSGTPAAIPFGDTDERDTDSIHNPSSNNSRFTVPAGGGGVWAVEWKIFMAAGTTGAGDVGWGLQSYIRKNGTTDVDPRYRARTITDADTGDGYGYRELVLADGDYIEIMGTQASGGTATIGHASTASAKHYCSFRRVGPS